MARDSQQGVVELFGRTSPRAPTVEGLLEAMDDAGVDLGVLTCGLGPARAGRRSGGLGAEDFLALAEEHSDRFLVAPTVERAAKPRATAPASGSWPSIRRWRWCASRPWSSSTS